MELIKNTEANKVECKNNEEISKKSKGLQLKVLTYLVCTGELKIENLKLSQSEIEDIQKIKITSEIVCMENDIHKAIYVSRMINQLTNVDSSQTVKDVLDCKYFKLDENTQTDNLSTTRALIFSDTAAASQKFKISNEVKQIYREILKVVATKSIYDINDFTNYVTSMLGEIKDSNAPLTALIVRSILLSSGETYSKIIRSIVVSVLN